MKDLMKLLKEMLGNDDIFGSSNMFTTYSVFNINDELDNIDYPKDDDPNYNKTIETKETNNHIVTTETWESVDKSTTISRTTMESKMNTEEVTIDELEKQKQQAIVNDNFEKAAEIRDKIKELRK